MTIVRQTRSTPGTHALVIGIGRYDWLLGGTNPTFSGTEGMMQLTSPPASARAFATWLLQTYDNPQTPLASLELLISDGQSQLFNDGASDLAVEPATFVNVSGRINEWANRGAKKDDLLLFFFSGHGISAGAQTTLLCEDFGSNELAPLSHSIDFTKLHLGLDRIPARRQCFFLDACRAATATILQTYDYYGQPVIEPLAARNPDPRLEAVFRSTLDGQGAYGRPGKASYFTEALLRSFEGPATDDDDDGMTWWVQTGGLLKALPQVLRRTVDPGVRIEPAGTEIVNFPLHRLHGRPQRIPVDVGCFPEASTAGAILSCSGTQASQTRAVPSADVWQLELSEGRYTFKAEIGNPTKKIVELDDEQIRPCYRNIRIPV